MRVEQTAEAGTRYIEHEWQAKMQTATSTTNQQIQSNWATTEHETSNHIR